MRRDDAYLLDMLVAARKAVAFAAEVTYQNSHVAICTRTRSSKVELRPFWRTKDMLGG